MKMLKPIGFLLAGAVAGAVATVVLTPAPVQAQAGAGTRLVITQAGGAQTPSNVPSQALYFIKDTKSSGCWLGSAGVGGGLALTPAPKEACE
jgi:hypothetical protein